MTSPHDEERISYHALACRAEGEYRTLEGWRKAHGSWDGVCAAMDIPPAERTRAWERLAALGVDCLTASAVGFPPLLREMPWPPFGLYVRGAPLAETPAVAIVGTRKATNEGRTLARRFAREIAGQGITVVSGLAFGIDAAAHEGALEAGGKTVAVLASGADIISPRSHEGLGKTILARGGTIVSEYPPGTPAMAHRFLERNRIISGLSRAIIVIEAPEESGALATARFALDQNRDVFVVPGPVWSPQYKGSHTLLKAGAALVTDAAEVIEAMGLRLTTHDERLTTMKELPFDENQKKIIHALSASGKSMSADAIAREADLPPEAVQRLLGELTLSGAVHDHGGVFSLSN